MQTDCFLDAASDRDKKPIGKLATINPRYKGFEGREYPFIEMAAVAEQFGGIQYITKRDFEGSGLARFKVGDTLFAKITPCPENGKVAFVGDLPDELGIGSTEFIVLSPRECCDPRFLYHLACCHEVRGRAIGRMEGSTGRQRVPDDAFKKRLIVPVPSPEEQAAIARFLDAVDTAIERTQNAAAASADLEYSLLHELLAQGQGPPGTDIGKAAKASKRQRVDEVAEVGSGVTLGNDVSGVRSVQLPYLRVANVQDGRLDLATIKTVRVPARDVDRYRLQAGDVLMTEGGDIDKLGRGTIWHGQIEDCLHQNHIFRVRANRDKLEPCYFSWVVQSDIAKAYFLRVAKRTTNLASINKTQLRAFMFPVPDDLEDQRIIADTMQAVRAVAEGYRAKIDRLTDLKRSLMHDLVTGKVRTDQLKLDEVAA